MPVPSDPLLLPKEFGHSLSKKIFIGTLGLFFISHAIFHVGSLSPYGIKNYLKSLISILSLT
jgi:hypothetical protein